MAEEYSSVVITHQVIPWLATDEDKHDPLLNLGLEQHTVIQKSIPWLKEEPEKANPWSPEVVNLLMLLVDQNKDNFKKMGKKKVFMVWLQIAKKLRDEGYVVSWRCCQKKYKNIKNGK